MKEQHISSAATATAFELDSNSLFSELGFSATFFDSMPAEILIVGNTGGIVAANELFRKKFGDRLGVYFQSLLLNEAAEINQHLAKTLATGTHSFDVIYKSDSSVPAEYDIEAFRLTDADDRVALIHRVRSNAHLGFWLKSENARPESESHRSAENADANRESSSHEFYRLFLEQSEYEIARFDLSVPLPTVAPPEDQIDAIVKNAALAIHSVSKSESIDKAKPCENGLSFGGFFGSPETAREIARVFVESGHTLLRKELVEASTDGKELYFHSNLLGVVEDGKLLRIWLSRRDITLRKQAEKAYLVAEDQLRQSQKIEPIGRLAGGIAHDFNNFLAVIMLQIEMMRQEIDESSPLNKRINEITTVTDKAANMVKQLLAFGRKQTMRPQAVILSDIVEEFTKMIRSLIGEDIEIIVESDSELGICFVDPNQITQILMNLAVNSKDAMPDGGVLRISTKNMSIDSNTFKHRAQPKGNYIELAVEDTGVGMNASTRKHVFEPFFTTKEAHKGTGLGLATVYGIVKQSKGFVWVDSKINEGTTFKIQFPRTDIPAKAVKRATTGLIPRGDETILVVEDEELIRKTAVEVLSSLGYKILEASDGAEALRLAKEHEGAIHLLLTDVVMPKMNGRDLAQRVRHSHKDLSVLFMSGYADDIVTRHGILEDDVHFLGKPFSPLTLAQRVRDAISGSA